MERISPWVHELAMFDNKNQWTEGFRIRELFTRNHSAHTYESGSPRPVARFKFLHCFLPRLKSSAFTLASIVFWISRNSAIRRLSTLHRCSAVRYTLPAVRRVTCSHLEKTSEARKWRQCEFGGLQTWRKTVNELKQGI